MYIKLTILADTSRSAIDKIIKHVLHIYIVSALIWMMKKALITFHFRFVVTTPMNDQIMNAGTNATPVSLELLACVYSNSFCLIILKVRVISYLSLYIKKEKYFFYLCHLLFKTKNNILKYE